MLSTIYSVSGRCSQYKLFGICPGPRPNKPADLKPTVTPL